MLSNTLHHNFPKKRASLRSYLLRGDDFMIARLMHLAETHHCGIRKDGVTNEFAHQVDIASYLMTLPLSEKDRSVLVALVFIHDLFEDHYENVNENDVMECLAPKNKQERELAERIIRAGYLLSKKEFGIDGSVTNKDKTKYFNDMLIDPLVVLAKCGDGLSNLVDMVGVFDLNKMEKYVHYLKTQHLRIAKIARNRYPEYRMAFENLKYCISRQIDAVDNIIKLLKDKK